MDLECVYDCLGSSKHLNNDFPLLVADWALTSSTSFHLLLEWRMIPVSFEPVKDLVTFNGEQQECVGFPAHSQVIKIKQEFEKIKHTSPQQLEKRGVIRSRIYRQRSCLPLSSFSVENVKKQTQPHFLSTLRDLARTSGTSPWIAVTLSSATNSPVDSGVTGLLLVYSESLGLLLTWWVALSLKRTCFLDNSVSPVSLSHLEEQYGISMETSFNSLITSQVPSTLPRSLLELSMRNNFHGNLPDNVGDLEFYRFWFQESWKCHRKWPNQSEHARIEALGWIDDIEGRASPVPHSSTTLSPLQKLIFLIYRPSKLDTPWSLVVNVVMRNLRGESFIRRVCREDDDEKRYLKRRKIVLDLDSFGEGLRC
ncbi:hypothetical protein NC652_005317 [Populus alba x Populus x berolinensis]|nr:hypothetical protein NC652_005317 [Populus alba x Populus x berolinensis]